MTIQNKFTPEQQIAIGRKVEQLRKIKDGTLDVRELADLITQKRLAWLRGNRSLLSGDLGLAEAACRLLFIDEMQVSEGVIVTRISENAVRIESRNFCPYLEACQRLGMDTRYVCKEIGEPSIVAFFQEIDPTLSFRRDYDKIRPHNDCCVEYLEVAK